MPRYESLYAGVNVFPMQNDCFHPYNILTYSADISSLNLCKPFKMALMRKASQLLIYGEVRLALSCPVDKYVCMQLPCVIFLHFPAETKLHSMWNNDLKETLYSVLFLKLFFGALGFHQSVDSGQYMECLF